MCILRKFHVPFNYAHCLVVGLLRSLKCQFQQFRESSEPHADKDYRTVHPVFAVVEQNTFYEKVEKFWIEGNAPSAFEAIIAGVVALGSFFSAHLGHPREADIVQHAKEILEDESFQPTVVRYHFGCSCSMCRALEQPHPENLISPKS
jgi:hypothetical protein